MTDIASSFRLFITGTDTGVGKTHVTCLIVRQLIAAGIRVAAYKPVCSGAIWFSQESPNGTLHSRPRWDDVERLMSATGDAWPRELICPQCFLAPLAAPISARQEGKTVDFQQLIDGASAFGEIDALLIEGAGGWLSPLTETHTVADLAVTLNAHVLIVARPGLGTINHTLLTIESVRARGLNVAGIVLNEANVTVGDDSVESNPDEIEARSGAPVFGTIRYGSSTDLHRNGELVTINWRQLNLS